MLGPSLRMQKKNRVPPPPPPPGDHYYKSNCPQPPLCFLALLYNFTGVYTNIPSCRRDESKTSICTIKFLYHDQ